MTERTRMAGNQKRPMRPLRLLRYLRSHLGELTIILISMSFMIGFEVLQPWPLKILVDHILGQQPLPESLQETAKVLPGLTGVQGLLAWVCAGMVLLFLASTAMSMLHTRAAVRLGQRMVYDLGSDLFLHLQRLSLRFHAARSVGDLIDRVMRDSYCMHVLVLEALLPVMHSMGMLIAIFLIMWQLDPTLTLVSLGVTPFLVLSIRIFANPMRERSREHRDLEGLMTSMVQQTLSAIPIVQAFTREELEHARFRSTATKALTAYKRSIATDMWFKLLIGVITALGTAAVMWIGAQHALQGKMTVGTILIFLSYLAALYGPLNALSYTTSTIQAAAASADRVLEVLDDPRQIRDIPSARPLKLQGHILYEQVTVGFTPGQSVLKEVSFEAKPGQVIAIVGPTGAGKSTLISLLLRFLDPWTGRIVVDGHNLRQIRLRSLREQIGIVLQEAFILPMTVGENIAYGQPQASREDILVAARAANADEFIRSLPDGYDTVLGERGCTLSGGEKQRLSIARAFLKRAPIVILDEPTSALDAQMEALLVQTLQHLMEGRTTLIIAHRLSTIRSADQILVLEHGRLTEQGRHSDLISKEGPYARLYRHQLNFAESQPILRSTN
jgi:ABC-type multidrug transport system fused ATPase/permease subunit